ncbi:hypothetical protein Ahy_B07g088220 isoform B [Arachis hypogaea]|uniref:Uncharacterized protein n=1 Tax=Arachis hypogaea TaxID=3818 RepID=A0A444YDZ9_ARAHY|nr:hypothetical protein Ahy_B07g088220 isoform B [Arachis hypogaea]
MANEKTFLVLVHYRWSIKKKTRSGIKFTDKDPLSVFLKPSTSFTEFLNSIIQKLGLQGMKRVEKLFYRISISVLRAELLAKLVDVVSNSGGSNRNSQPSATAACSSSRPIGASSSVPVIAPKAMLVASSSFATDLNRSHDGEVCDTTNADITDTAPISLQGGEPDGVDDVLRDDDDDDDVESDTIANDSGHDKAGSNLGFGARDTQDIGGLAELQVGQQFQDKEDVVLSVKTYSI